MHGLKYGTKKHSWKHSHSSHSGLLYWVIEVSSASHSLATSVPWDSGLVSSNPALSLSKHWLEMTLQSIVRHSWVCSNRQSTTTEIHHGKINARMLPAFLQMSYTACLFVQTYSMWHWGSNTRWLPAAFKRPPDASLFKSWWGRRT